MITLEWLVQIGRHTLMVTYGTVVVVVLVVVVLWAPSGKVTLHRWQSCTEVSRMTGVTGNEGRQPGMLGAACWPDTVNRSIKSSLATMQGAAVSQDRVYVPAPAATTAAARTATVSSDAREGGG